MYYRHSLAAKELLFCAEVSEIFRKAYLSLAFFGSFLLASDERVTKERKAYEKNERVRTKDLMVQI